MIWTATLRMIAARPLIGQGLGTYVVEYPHYRLPEYFLRPKATNVTDHAHNELLETAAEQGLIGLAALLWLWAAALGRGVSSCRRQDAGERRCLMGLLGAAGLLMLHGMVDIDLRYPPNQSLLWLLMGLLVGTGSPAVTSHYATIRSSLARLHHRNGLLRSWNLGRRGSGHSSGDGRLAGPAGAHSRRTR